MSFERQTTFFHVVDVDTCCNWISRLLPTHPSSGPMSTIPKAQFVPYRDTTYKAALILIKMRRMARDREQIPAGIPVFTSDPTAFAKSVAAFLHARSQDWAAAVEGSGRRERRFAAAIIGACRAPYFLT